jgi:hypothetical protein
MRLKEEGAEEATSTARCDGPAGPGDLGQPPGEDAPYRQQADVDHRIESHHATAVFLLDPGLYQRIGRRVLSENREANNGRGQGRDQERWRSGDARERNSQQHGATPYHTGETHHAAASSKTDGASNGATAERRCHQPKTD